MAYCPQSYDDYFVESYDDRGKVIREKMRQVEQHRKREVQLGIAEELSQLVSEEYRDDILSHMEKTELETLPDVASIEIQTEIQWFMRPYLLDFLIEAHAAFGLLPETLFLAVNLLDRYCSRRIVYKRHYQLVGCAALLIAAKYGDRKERVPTIRELRGMCCGLYEDDMFGQMEWHVLQTLDWAIGHPTIDSFLQLALEDLPRDIEVENMTRYIAEIAMFHKEFISKRPSDMARSALALARYILNRPQPPPEDWVSLYEQNTLVTLSQHLHRPSQVLSRKYSTSQLSRVSGFLEAFLARQASIAKCYATPPTPPSEASSREGLRVGPHPGSSATCVTPHRGQQFGFSGNGSMTPPITPNAPELPGYKPFVEDRRPPTPLSMGSHPAPRHFDANYQLPPIHRPNSIF